MKKRLIALALCAVLCVGMVFSLASCGASEKSLTVTVVTPDGTKVVNEAKGTVTAETLKDALCALGYVNVSADGAVTVNAQGCTDATVTVTVGGTAADWDAKVENGQVIVITCA